jgi:hypothetical protein
MSQATHHFPAFLQDTDMKFLKYGAVAITALSLYLTFGALALCAFAVLLMSVIVLKGKADKMATMSGRNLTTISRTKLVDGGTFQQESDEKTVATRTTVLDGGSFERFQS